MRTLGYLKKKKNYLLTLKTLKKHSKKLHTYGSWEVFFSAAPTAQNCPELHFRFINSFIQPSRVGSLCLTNKDGYSKPFPAVVYTNLVLKGIIEIDSNKKSIKLQVDLWAYWKDEGIAFSNDSLK